MNRFTGVMLSVTLAVSAAFAGDTAKQHDKSEGKHETITGYLVDIVCASENARHPAPGFAAKHTKDCLRVPDCEGSGYAILTANNKVIRLDKQSSENAKKLISATNKKDNWKISATGVLNESGFAAQSLKLQ